MVEGITRMKGDAEDALIRFKEEIDIKETVKGSLEHEITTLIEIRHNVGEKLKEYGAAIQGENGFENRKNDINDYATMIAPMIVQAAGDKKGAIDNKIKQYDDKITALSKDIDDWKTNKMPAAKQACYTSKINFGQATKDFNDKEDEIKKLKETINNKLEKLDKLKKSIENIEITKDPGKAEKMYLMLSELKKELDDTLIKSVDDLVSELYIIWAKFDTAETEFYKKKKELKNQEIELKGKEKKLENLKDNRLDELLKTVGK